MAIKNLQINIDVNTDCDTEESVYDLLLALVNEANDYGFSVSSATFNKDFVFNATGLKKISFPN